MALLVAGFCGAIGYAAISTVLGLQVYEMSGHELDLGLLGMAQFLPVFLLIFITGSVADRYDRALVCSLSMVGQGLVALGLGLYVMGNPTAVAPIFLLVVFLGTSRAFLAAAQGPLPADIVPPDRLPWLVARRSLATRPGMIIGPILGGLLYEVDRSLPYLAIAILFGLAAGMLWVLHLRRRPGRAGSVAARPAGRNAWRDGLEGIAIIRRTPLLLGAVSLDLFAVLFGGAIALLPALAQDHLGTDAVGLGVLRAGVGVGSGLVLIALAWRPVARRVGRTLLATIAVFGLATIVLGATTNFVIALVAIAVLSGADSVSVFIRGNIVPLSSPPEARGRDAAVESLFVGASNELGAFESGVTGELFGSSGAIILGGAATLAVVGAYAFAFPVLRDLDRYPTVGAGIPRRPDLTGPDPGRDA